MPDDAVAAWLRRQLDERGWTQRELAGRTGVSPPTVSRWCSGASGIGPGARGKLAKALGLTPADVAAALDGAAAEDRRALRERIRAELAASGWTQEDLARRLGVTPPAVGNWLAGRSSPSPLLRAMLDAILNNDEDPAAAGERGA